VAASPDGRYLLLLHPTHLLGVEAALTAQTTKYLGISSGGANVRQRVDLVARATRNLKAGEMLMMGGDGASRINRHTVEGLDHMLLPARALAHDSPMPYYLAANNRLRRDVAAGAIICGADVEIPESSRLLQLRNEQDRLFQDDLTDA
jgi:predicted homoserine dehydrogenase-like protein